MLDVGSVSRRRGPRENDGGNAEKLRGPFPDHVHLFDNIEGMVGGVRLWDDRDCQVERVADTAGT